ncbi:MAG: ACT domain-containing protein [Eubacteriaceae bacterium]|jgi:ACT domain-containing protein|nr:ACT domain-containing protein [Eubacteriaceae bacterium]
MKAVITVVGKDSVGILAKVSCGCSDFNANILDVTQSVIDDYFTMVMVVEISKLNADLSELNKKLEADLPTMKIHVMHEDIFNAMHRI